MSQTDHPSTAGRHAPAAGGSLPALLEPDRRLFTYYVLQSFVLGPFFWTLLIPRYFRYHTLRYEVEEEGITMRWGVLFRREVSLTYARIQDIHLSSNLIERWLGLARIQIQTASGSSSAEMTIEGVPEFDAMRDFLYDRMRGARDHAQGTGPATPRGGAPAGDSVDELASTLREIAAEVRAIRAALPLRHGEGGERA